MEMSGIGIDKVGCLPYITNSGMPNGYILLCADIRHCFSRGGSIILLVYGQGSSAKH